MKNKEQFQLKDFFGWSVFALLTLSLAILATSCGKKDGKTTVATTPGTTYDPSCPACIADGTLLGSALGFYGGTLSKASYNIQLGLTFTGTAGTTGILGYTGPVSAVGVMSVKVSSQFCPMPVGTYQVTTTATGQWNSTYGGPQNLSLDAQHTDGSIVKMRFLYGQVYAYQPNLIDDVGRVYPYGLVAEIVMDSVNGNPCVVGYPNLRPLNQYFFTY